MYCGSFKKNESMYLILKNIIPNLYDLEQIFLLDTAVKYIINSKNIIIKVKIKEIIHHIFFKYAEVNIIYIIGTREKNRKRGININIFLEIEFQLSYQILH